MNERLTQIKADIRFWWWKVRHVHAQRYISVITILAVLAGLTFFSFNGNQNKAYAANASWSGNTINLAGAEANFMLLNNGTSDGTCLWPMNKWSTDNFNYNGVTPYRGKACTSSSGSLTVIVDPGATLNMVGDISTSILSVNGGTVTTAKADSKGNAIPYASRRDYYVERYTGFLALSMTAPAQTAGKTYRRILLRASNYDDAVIVEGGWRDDEISLDAAGLTFQNNAYGYYGSRCWDMHSSFRSSSDGCGGVFSYANGGQKTFYWKAFPASSVVYIPIRITAMDVTSTHTFSINYQVEDGDVVNGSFVNGTVVTSDRLLPVSMLYGPQESGANVGKVDTSAQGYMRYEYAAAPNGSSGNILDSSLSKMYKWNVNRYEDKGTPDYSFFPRVNLADDGTFNGYIQARGVNAGKFFFNYPEAWNNGNIAENPLSNSKNVLGVDYDLGFAVNGEGAPRLMQNYKMHYHNDAVTNGIVAGLRLSVSGDTVVMNSGSINVDGKGLPGGKRTWDDDGLDDQGYPGIGGEGNNGSSPGWYFGSSTLALDNGHGWNAQGGSNWANGNGGGGGNGGQYGDDYGVGGGGGGVIGFGAAQRLLDNTGIIAISDPDGASKRKLGGNGGAGLGELGGAVYGYLKLQRLSFGTDGKSDRARYYNYDSNSFVGLGGGGGTASNANILRGAKYVAGDGGGSIKLVVGGNLSLNRAKISADGENGVYTTGSGGAGMVSISVKNSFDLSSQSSLSAAGGSSTRGPSDRGNVYIVGGSGGGGLIKVRAADYKSSLDNAGDESAWPPNPDACSIKGQMNSSRRLYIHGGWFAESGMIDLGYYDGTPYCGSGGNNTSNIQISKQMQQWKGSGSGPTDRAAVIDDANWSDVLTVTAGKYIRAKISVVNLSSSAMTGVSVADKLPIDTMTLFGFSGGNVAILDKNGVFTSAVNGGAAATISVPNITVPANSAVLVEYATQVK